MTAFNLVAYERMGLCNPVSEAAVLAMLDQTDLAPGDRAAELGCGNGALAVLLARHGLSVQAFDRDEAMADLARRKAEEASQMVAVTVGEADSLAQAGAPWRLIAALGTTALGDFGRIRDWLPPGGWLLWGDLFHRQTPTPVMAENSDYPTDAGWRTRAETAGLDLVDARISGADEWEAYTAGLKNAVGSWAAENPDHPRRRLIELRASAMAGLYGEMKNSFGFALYLFRRP